MRELARTVLAVLSTPHALVAYLVIALMLALFGWLVVDVLDTWLG